MLFIYLYRHKNYCFKNIIAITITLMLNFWKSAWPFIDKCFNTSNQHSAWALVRYLNKFYYVLQIVSKQPEGNDRVMHEKCEASGCDFLWNSCLTWLLRSWKNTIVSSQYKLYKPVSSCFTWEHTRSKKGITSEIYVVAHRLFKHLSLLGERRKQKATQQRTILAITIKIEQLYRTV